MTIPINPKDRNHSLRNQKASRKVLMQILEIWLGLMDLHGDNHIPEHNKTLYESAGINKRTFYNNFSSLNDIDYWAKYYLTVDVIGKIKKFASVANMDLKGKLFWIFKAFREAPILTDYTLRRCTVTFWEAMLSPLEPAINDKYPSYTQEIRRKLFLRFAASFQITLLEWRNQNYPLDRIDIFIGYLLNTIVIEKNNAAWYERMTVNKLP